MLSSQQQSNILFIQGRGYEIVSEIKQQGAQSTNYIAKCSGDSNEQVIIKQYDQIRIDELEVLKIIQKEQIDNKFKNKHIIKILGIQDCQQKEQINLRIVMEKGKNNAQQLIANTSLDLVQKFKLFKQMIKGVKELHALGYVHRDLKLENFVYFENKNKSYKVKLIDFGLAKKGSTRLKTLQVGTWNYMSPEVMLGEGNYDNTADIWSLGIILFQILTAESFLKAKTTKELITQMNALTQEQIDMKIDQINCMQPSEKEIIKSLLQKESKNRFNLEIILKLIDQHLKTIKEQEQKEIQQFKDQQQLIIDSIQCTIKNIIQFLTEKQPIINQINLQNQKKQELLTYINNELSKYEKILLKNQQRYKTIFQAQIKEMLKNNDNELSQEYQQYNNDQKLIIDRIMQEQSQLEQFVKEKEQEDRIKIESEQKLKLEQEQILTKEKEYYQSQLKLLKQQLNQQSPQIQQIQHQIDFYQRIEIQIQCEENIQDMIKNNQQITQDIQTEEFNGKIIEQSESQQQQIMTYQSCNNKLEQILQAQNTLKIQIEEINEQIQQRDRRYLSTHEQEVEELYKELIDYQEKYQYLTKKEKYSNQIAQIIHQIGQAIDFLDNLKQLISKRTIPAYLQYSQINQQIHKSIVNFEKQYGQLHQQIYYDEQIELKNQERIKKLEMAKDQFDKFIIKMNNLKDQAKILIQNEYCNNEKTQKLINTRLAEIEQNIMQQKMQFVKFTQLNQLDSCENINSYLKQLKEFQGKLKEVELNEIEYLNQLELIIKIVGEETKCESEKEIHTLNNQLKNRYTEYKKALQSIKFQFEGIEFYQQMNQNKDNLQKELEQEISILNQYSQIKSENMQLLEIELQQNTKKQGKQQQLIQNILNRFQYTCQQKGQRLDDIIKKVAQKQQEINFCLMDENLIKNYEYLKMLEEQFSIELTSINQRISSQQLNELKEYILKVFGDVDKIMKNIPEKDEIEKFNNTFLQNLESYQKIYALINYIKQYHLTRYYERIKENANQQKSKQQNNIESDYQKQFQSKLYMELEEYTKKEKEAQDIFLRYENILFKNYNKMRTEEMEKDKEFIENKILEVENSIKQKNLVKLKSKLKDQNKIKKIINDQEYYKIIEFTQMLIFKIIINNND
ncbi:unnamed protein product [Paramecium octaurelia]|uniref:Protein kinase domain-containing protein n=1 Tax=Paramecium octaurelia TaxID=43137 RepID=A0A8S1XJ22_PAROT|nr:unnamed protein product [Paramecium octaurelia]